MIVTRIHQFSADHQVVPPLRNPSHQHRPHFQLAADRLWIDLATFVLNTEVREITAKLGIWERLLMMPSVNPSGKIFHSPHFRPDSRMEAQRLNQKAHC